MKNLFLKHIFKVISVISFVFLLIFIALLSHINNTANSRLNSCINDINNNSAYYKKEISNKDALINKLKQIASTSEKQY